MLGWLKEVEEGYDGNPYSYSFAVLDRFLAGDEAYDPNKKDVPLDYKILSYGICTLYLILLVEFIRHSIDHAAHGRPFFTAVLLMVYSELATLGIVEFCLFLWGKYGEYDKDMKKKFADVHFALFFVAIINAVQYSLTSIFSTRFSNSMWIQTEQLELDHYVEIREEYERVNHIITNLYTRHGKWIRNIILFVSRPGLRRRYESLRVQVRFHELRLHLLDSNNLPLTLKVSDYLKRSELAILIGLVHVSPTAWVLLIGGLNLVYFVVGIIEYTTAKISLVSKTMAGIFFAIDICFIIISWALRRKMHRIFQTIIKMKPTDTSDRKEGIERQKRLFWFGSPPLVIYMIQLMNFGYAISLSVVLIWHNKLETMQIPVWWVYLIVSLGCYLIFLYNLSKLLPEYTLCTSLGYLTNRKELQETVAMYRLEVAKRKQRQIIIENVFVNNTAIVQENSTLISTSSIPNNNGGINKQMRKPSASTSSDSAIMLVADLVKVDTGSLRSQLPEEAEEILKSREERKRQRRLNRNKSVSDGVALMRGLGRNETVSSHEKIETKKNVSTRRSRRKTMSQPGIIQGWQNITALEQQNRIGHSVDDIDVVTAARKENRKKSRSDSRVIQSWQDSLQLEEPKVKLDDPLLLSKGGPHFILKGDEINKSEDKDLVPNWKKERANRLANRRRARKKAQSESAVIQSWQDYSVGESTRGKSDNIPEENYNSSDLRALSSDGSEYGIEVSKTNFCGNGFDNQQFFLQNQLDLHSLKETDVDDPETSCTVKSPLASTSSPTSLKHSNFGSDTVLQKRNIGQGYFEGESSLLSDMSGKLKTTKKIVNLSDAVLVDDGNGDNDKTGNDDDTVETNKSIGNLSDIDCVQAEVVGITRNKRKTNTSKNNAVKNDVSLCTAILRQTKLYFVGSVYPDVSHVLGTSIIFFLVGHRITIFLNKSESFFMKWPWFWIEVAMLVFFMIADLAIFSLFPLRKYKTESERRLVIATVIDFLIVSTVLVLFIVAEEQRCCTETDEETSTRRVRELAEIGFDYSFESECTCDTWGYRTYDGIGRIEPFTSLICLRLFRFYFARKLVRGLNETDKDLRSIHESKHHDGDYNGDHTGHHENAGTALELWELAIAEFPDIVEKYGQFSGELLQAMLGLQVAMESTIVPHSAPLDKVVHGEEEEALTTKKQEKSSTWQSHIKLSGSRFGKLPPRAQGIIIAGKVGQPVKPMQMQIQRHHNIGIELCAGLVEFEVDIEEIDRERNNEYTFVAPFARLVRSMRRCDRRHLPLLKEWISVDVVITQFEIVYFEAIDGNCPDLDNETKLHIEACRLSLQATKGGKNLRLCDVAKGRKVVGHLDFDDVIEIHVAKDDVPVTDMTLVEKAAALYDKDEDLNVEQWTDIYKESDAKQKYARTIRWALIQEERLKVSTASGTLLFRFYSDLAYFEAEKSGDAPRNSQIITKDIAFQWAETISRICGRDQLEQLLPHFGEGNEDELIDYLEVVHFHEKEAKNEKRSTARGVGNREYMFHGNGAQRKKICSEEELQSTRTKIDHSQPVKSMFENTSTEILASIPEKQKSHRRLFSFGESMEHDNIDNETEESQV
mmetsp:Transcript_58839/g.65899  ORF Transcript_58839/g.65899 Transcript_58839/m.65899 type:complete len:1588 (-) Transcript_58839:90-4853(-)